MDITYYERTVTHLATGRTHTLRSSEPTSQHHYVEANGYRLDQTERTVLHLEIGTPVDVHAFGRLRPGRVTKLGRTKVTVEYARNAAGTLASRSFGAGDIYPVTGTPFEREVISA